MQKRFNVRGRVRAWLLDITLRAGGSKKPCAWDSYFWPKGTMPYEFQSG
jgi:hypothetical protein